MDNDENGIKAAKAACRAEAKRLLKETGEEYRSEASAAIALNALGLKEMKKAKTVLAYCSVGSEPGTLALISKLLASGKKVCLPLCTDLDEEGHRIEDAEARYAMEARLIKSFDELEPGAYGIPEPKDGTKTVKPEDIDLIILPCVACDRECRRLGHGAGYYDKYLSMITDKCTTIALCYDKLIMETIPTEEHDMRVDAVITEKQIYRWRP